jgi:SAM-dependent methyltransferase
MPAWLSRFTRRRASQAPGDARPKGWLSPDEDLLVPPREVWIGPDDSISHYFRWIWEYLAYLTLLTDLRRTHRVLELGCGHGRVGRGLLEYLRSPGGYVGLDVDARRIADAQERIERRWPNFQFVHADVFNRQYNPGGTQHAAAYRFPFDDASFDVVFAASLLTHLLPAEARNYFRECGRVLKPEGYCLISGIALDYYRGPGTPTSRMYEVDHPLPGYPGVAVRDADNPDVLIGYSVETIRALAEGSGLSLTRVIPGLWSEGTDWAVNEHDLFLFRRT